LNAKASFRERISIASTIQFQRTLQIRLNESANASSHLIQQTDTFLFQASFKDNPLLQFKRSDSLINTELKLKLIASINPKTLGMKLNNNR